jgi:hypothetical protein
MDSFILQLESTINIQLNAIVQSNVIINLESTITIQLPVTMQLTVIIQLTTTRQLVSTFIVQNIRQLESLITISLIVIIQWLSYNWHILYRGI